MSEVQTLHENEWVSLLLIRDPDAGVDGYVYSRETRCDGRIVAVLPYQIVDGEVLYLVKSETTPCWGMDQVLSSITGGYEGGDIEDDAVREMLEETGYAITRDELIPLGTSRASKSSDTVYSLFSVDLTGRVPGEAIGDGSRVEAESLAVWVDEADLAQIVDPQVAVMFLRLKAREERIAGVVPPHVLRIVEKVHPRWEGDGPTLGVVVTNTYLDGRELHLPYEAQVQIDFGPEQITVARVPLIVDRVVVERSE